MYALCGPLLSCHSFAPFFVTLNRVSVTSVADSLASFTNSGFFQLAKQLDVSVDEVASTFSVILPGAAVFMYVVLAWFNEDI